MKSNISSEGAKAIRLLKDYVESWKRTDFHSLEKKRDIEQMYLFFKENCKLDCSSDIIDIGYSLADIYDKELEFEKSLEITKQILLYFELSKTKEELALDKEYIRKVIGCAYGMTIAEVKSDAQKIDLLEQSEKLFGKARELCENYAKVIFRGFCDKEFLWGLYYSDHGTFLVNRGDSYKNKQEYNKAKENYKEALKEYEKGLDHRNNFLGAIDDSDCDMKNDADKIFGVNSSGMGVALFQLGEYEKSIKKCKEALGFLDEFKDMEGIIRSIRCITEGTIILLEKMQDNSLLENFNICEDYLDKLGNKYVKEIEEIRNKMKKYVR